MNQSLLNNLSSAAQRAYLFIRQGIENSGWRKGEALPPIKTLAKLAGVSRVPMSKAIVVLKKDGFLHGLPRAAIRAGAAVDVIYNSPSPTLAIWQLKRIALEKDIAAGKFAHQDTLPSIKELQAQYGVCFSTMRKILRAMVSDGTVSIRGRAYELYRQKRVANVNRIGFITDTIRSTPRSALNPAEYRVIESLERECVRRGMHMEMLETNIDDSVATARMLSERVTDDSMMGFVIDLWWFESESHRKALTDCIDRLAAFKRPVSIIDEIGNFILPMQHSSNPLFQVFRAQGKKSGNAMARLLLGLGHQSVAYISSAHQESWSQQRLEGIREQYMNAGLGENVHACVTDGSSFVSSILVYSDLDETTVRKVLSIDRTKQQAEEEYQVYLDLKKNARPLPVNRNAIQAIRNDLSLLPAVIRQKSSSNLIRFTAQAIFNAANMLVNAALLEPLFAQAFGLSGVTAWTCTNDLSAISALEFLRSRNVSVPEEISVTGFDNLSAAAVENRLTSFDFNTAGIMYRALEFISRPPRTRGPYRHFPIEIEGIIMERGTTGKAKNISRKAG
jgi:DNA-binding LacI/PurR family transcriptional regulator